jgi:hypothetical protein
MVYANPHRLPRQVGTSVGWRYAKTMRHARRTIASLASVLLLLVLAVPTYAAGAGAGSRGSQNCVNQLERITPGLPDARIASSLCFDSFAAAFRHVTQGQLSVASDLRPEQVTQEMIAAAPSSSVVLGIDWEYDNYVGGFTAIWEGSSTCTASQAWQLSYVGDVYNDKISSAKGYGGCHHFHHYENGAFGGAVLTCSPNCATMGVMNNQTSSLKWGY